MTLYIQTVQALLFLVEKSLQNKPPRILFRSYPGQWVPESDV